MKIRVHIERIVVDAAVAGQASPRALRESIQAELARRLAMDSKPASARAVRGPDIRFSRDPRGRETGTRIGAAIHAAIGGRGGIQ